MLFKLPVIAAAWLVALTSLAALPAAALELGRGVAVHEWLNWSPIDADGSYKWPPYRSETEWLAGYRDLSDWPEGDVFETIRALGFDFVRLTVDPGPLVASSGGRRGEALRVIESAVERITGTGLKVVLDLHAVRQVPQYGMDFIMGGAASEGVEVYEEMVADVARMAVAIGVDKVALEPYNEPGYYPCDTTDDGDWQRIMETTVAKIRAVSADLAIVATGGCGGSVAGLVDLDPRFDDANVYYSFHMYEPHAFTHQGLNGEEFLSGLPWPASAGTSERVVRHLLEAMGTAGLDANEQSANLAAVMPAISDYFASNWGQLQLDGRFSEVERWAKTHRIPTSRLFMGEFGAALMSWDGRKGAFEADRSRYMTAVRQAAEQRGIPWSAWEFSNPFGMSLIKRDGPAVPDEALLAALGLAAK
jgi:hypothetical protein